MPPPLGANWFACLSVESANTLTPAEDSMTEPETDSTLFVIQDTPPAKDLAGVPSPPSVSRRHLPCQYVVAAVLSPNSLHLDVEVKTTDTQQICHVSALLDSGATRLFIDATYVEQHRLTTRPLTHPIPVYNIDGTRNKAGSICSVVDLVLRYRTHVELGAHAISPSWMSVGATTMCASRKETSGRRRFGPIADSSNPW